MPATRNVRRIHNNPMVMPVSVGGQTGSTIGEELQLGGNGYDGLSSHVPNTTCPTRSNIPFVVPVSTPIPAIPFTNTPLWLTTTDKSGMRAQTAASTGVPRTRSRLAMKSPYNRVNSATESNAALDEIIKNCPAVDVLLGGYVTPRSSTHNRGRDQEHVSRPPNAFMVYRSYIWFTKQLDNTDERNLSCVSKLAAESWKDMSAQAQAPFHEIAALAKRKHAELHPDYKYAPSSRSEKATKKNAQLATKAREKVKVAATSTSEGFVASSLPEKARGINKPSASTGFVGVTPTSPEPSSSNSSSSVSPPATPDLGSSSPSSPELGYPWDCDIPNFPPRPRVRVMKTGLIPSPAISVLELNEDESYLDTFPDKYEQAASYHDLQPHALLFNEDGVGLDHNAQMQIIPPPHRESIDYSCFISGNPDAKLVSPTPTVCLPDAPSLGSGFSLDPSIDIDGTFHSSPSSNFDWSSFDMLTLGSDPIINQNAIYGPNDVQNLDPVISFF